jgi:hypothetical protein
VAFAVTVTDASPEALLVVEVLDKSPDPENVTVVPLFGLPLASVTKAINLSEKLVPVLASWLFPE